MAYDDSIKTAAALTGIARGVFETVYDGFAFSQYFPLQESASRVFTLPQAPVVSGETATKLTGYNTTAPRGDAEGAVNVITGAVARTSQQKRVDEYNLVSSPSADQLGDWMEDKARTQARQVANRLKLMTGELLATGKIDLSESNIRQVVDFNRPADNTVTLSGTGVWSDPKSDPIGDVRKWQVISGGSNVLWVSASTLRSLQRNTDLIKRALRRGSDLVTEISDADVLSVFLENGIQVNVIADTVNTIQTYAGQARSVIPANMAFLLPVAGFDVTAEDGIGYVHLAPTVEAEQANYGIGANERAGIFAGAFHQDDPEGYSVRVAAEFLPLLRAPRAVIAAQVAAA